MNLLKKIMGTVAATLLLAAILPTTANAAVMVGVDKTFTFSGLCDDCAGPAGLTTVPGANLGDGFYQPVTGTLMLTDFIAGTPLDSLNFVSFTYDGSSIIPGGFTVSAVSDMFLFSGTLDALGNVLSTVGLAWAGIPSAACPSGSCNLLVPPGGDWEIGPFSTPSDMGIGGTFAASIPEPGTLALFGLGLVGLGFARRKRMI